MQAITFGTLQAKEGQGEPLAKLVQEHMDMIQQQAGLKEAYVARAKGDPDKFLVVSVWESEEAQQAAVVKLSSEPRAAMGFLEMMQILNGQPEFGNYRVESISRGTVE